MPSNYRIQKGSSRKRGQTNLETGMAKTKDDVSEVQFLDAMKTYWETEFPSLALSFHSDTSGEMKDTMELFRKVLKGVCPSRKICASSFSPI